MKGSTIPVLFEALNFGAPYTFEPPPLQGGQTIGQALQLAIGETDSLECALHEYHHDNRSPSNSSRSCSPVSGPARVSAFHDRNNYDDTFSPSFRSSSRSSRDKLRGSPRASLLPKSRASSGRLRRVSTAGSRAGTALASTLSPPVNIDVNYLQGWIANEIEVQIRQAVGGAPGRPSLRGSGGMRTAPAAPSAQQMMESASSNDAPPGGAAPPPPAVRAAPANMAAAAAASLLSGAPFGDLEGSDDEIDGLFYPGARTKFATTDKVDALADTIKSVVKTQPSLEATQAALADVRARMEVLEADRARASQLDELREHLGRLVEDVQTVSAELTRAAASQREGLEAVTQQVEDVQRVQGEAATLADVQTVSEQLQQLRMQNAHLRAELEAAMAAVEFAGDARSQLYEVRQSLAELRAAQAAAPAAAAQHVEELSRELAELREAQADASQLLAEQLEGLRAHVRDVAVAAEAPALSAEQLAAVSRDVAALHAAREEDPTQAVWAELEELRAQLATVQAAAVEVHRSSDDPLTVLSVAQETVPTQQASWHEGGVHAPVVFSPRHQASGSPGGAAASETASNPTPTLIAGSRPPGDVQQAPSSSGSTKDLSASLVSPLGDTLEPNGSFSTASPMKHLRSAPARGLDAVDARVLDMIVAHVASQLRVPHRASRQRRRLPKQESSLAVTLNAESESSEASFYGPQDLHTSSSTSDQARNAAFERPAGSKAAPRSTPPRMLLARRKRVTVRGRNSQPDQAATLLNHLIDERVAAALATAAPPSSGERPPTASSVAPPSAADDRISNPSPPFGSPSASPRASLRSHSRRGSLGRASLAPASPEADSRELSRDVARIYNEYSALMSAMSTNTLSAEDDGGDGASTPTGSPLQERVTPPTLPASQLSPTNTQLLNEMHSHMASVYAAVSDVQEYVTPPAEPLRQMDALASPRLPRSSSYYQMAPLNDRTTLQLKAQGVMLLGLLNIVMRQQMVILGVMGGKSGMGMGMGRPGTGYHGGVRGGGGTPSMFPGDPSAWQGPGFGSVIAPCAWEQAPSALEVQRASRGAPVDKGTHREAMLRSWKDKLRAQESMRESQSRGDLSSDGGMLSSRRSHSTPDRGVPLTSPSQRSPSVAGDAQSTVGGGAMTPSSSARRGDLKSPRSARGPAEGVLPQPGEPATPAADGRAPKASRRARGSASAGTPRDDGHPTPDGLGAAPQGEHAGEEAARGKGAFGGFLRGVRSMGRRR